MSSLLHTALSLFLALLVGNPVCCCAAPLKKTDTPNTASPSTSCCCSQSDEKSKDKVPSKPHECPCAQEPSDIPSTEVTLPQAPSNQIVFLEKRERLSETFPRGPTSFPRPTTSAQAPPPPVRLLFQVFRL